MEIAQRQPNSPNFSLVAAISGVILIAVFFLAYLFVDFNGGNLAIRHHNAHHHAPPIPRQILPAPVSTLV